MRQKKVKKLRKDLTEKLGRIPTKTEFREVKKSLKNK